MSLRDAIHAVLAADSTLMGYLPGGLRGSDTDPEPPDSQDEKPMGFLGFLDEQETDDPDVVAGTIRLQVTDYLHSGYSRIRQALRRASQTMDDYVEAYEASAAIAVFSDDAAREVILYVGQGALGDPTVDELAQGLAQWIDWPYRKATGRVA